MGDGTEHHPCSNQPSWAGSEYRIPMNQTSVQVMGARVVLHNVLVIHHKCNGAEVPVTEKTARTCESPAF